MFTKMNVIRRSKILTDTLWFVGIWRLWRKRWTYASMEISDSWEVNL